MIVAAVKPHFSFVLVKARREYGYIKTMRALLRRFEARNYLPTLCVDDANFLFRSVVLQEHDPVKYAYKWPTVVDEWDEIFAKPFEQSSLSHGIFFGRAYETNERFSPAVRSAHLEMIKQNMKKIKIIEDWLYCHQDVLRQIVANF
jgi:hypothetical protein